MTQDASKGFVLDADAFICLHSLSLLSLMADRPLPPLYVTEFVARHELSALASHLSAMEASGRLQVAPLPGRDPNFLRFRQARSDKGESEAVAWCLRWGRTERPRFISNDRRARALAGAERVPSGDLLDFVLELLAAATISLTEAEEKLAPWQDPGQQRCRPADFTSLADTLTKRRKNQDPPRH